MSKVNEMKNGGGGQSQQQSYPPLPRGYTPPANPNPNMSQVAEAGHTHEAAACDQLLYKLINQLKTAVDSGMGDLKVVDLMKMKNITLETVTIKQIYDLIMKI